MHRVLANFHIFIFPYAKHFKFSYLQNMRNIKRCKKIEYVDHCSRILSRTFSTCIWYIITWSLRELGPNIHPSCFSYQRTFLCETKNNSFICHMQNTVPWTCIIILLWQYAQGETEADPCKGLMQQVVNIKLFFL